MDGVYGTDGTTITFTTSLILPIAVAVNNTVIQTYLQFNDTTHSNATTKVFDIGTCQTTFPGLTALKSSNFTTSDYSTKSGTEFFTLTTGYSALSTSLNLNTNSWSVSGEDFANNMTCSASTCLFKCTLKRLLSTDQLVNMNYNLGDTALVRAGFRVYSTATGATVTTQGYSSSILSVLWYKNAAAAFSIVATASALLAPLAMLLQ